MSRKTIGVLTSGGDAPGMNAALRAIVRSAGSAGMRVLGIRSGYKGLIEGDVVELGDDRVAGIIQRGGTVLHTARCPEFKTAAVQEQGIAKARELGLDGIIALGGDGTFKGAEKLSRGGIPTIGIPATIDNDIACTNYTIGFDTACNVAMEAIDRLRDTSESHQRCSVVEVMGHKTGYLALEVAVASGAAAVLIPERVVDLDREVIDAIRENRGRHSIVVVAEGYPLKAGAVAKRVAEASGVETRLTVLGHVQRGGSPTAIDRVFAARMGCKAVKLLEQGVGSRVVAVRDNDVVDYDIQQALAMQKPIDSGLYDIFRATQKSKPSA